MLFVLLLLVVIVVVVVVVVIVALVVVLLLLLVPLSSSNIPSALQASLQALTVELQPSGRRLLAPRLAGDALLQAGFWGVARARHVTCSHRGVRTEVLLAAVVWYRSGRDDGVVDVEALSALDVIKCCRGG